MISSFKGYKGYPFVTCLSVNEQVVHGFPSDRELLPGDIIGVDVGVVYNGYHADAARTISVGFVDKEVDRLLKTTKEALGLAISKIKEGSRLGDVSFSIEQKAKANDFEVIRNYGGHGIGENLHEDPFIKNYGSLGSGPVLLEGMVLAIEPMLVMGSCDVEVLADKWTVVTKDKKWSSHEEHTVLVTLEGSKVLAR